MLFPKMFIFSFSFHFSLLSSSSSLFSSSFFSLLFLHYFFLPSSSFFSREIFSPQIDSFIFLSLFNAFVFPVLFLFSDDDIDVKVIQIFR